MIGITRDEIKSTANFEVLSSANAIAQEIEDSYLSYWIAPLLLIKETVESENLGVNEKISMLSVGMKHVPDIVSLQIAVQGVATPLAVNQDQFTDLLIQAALNPQDILIINPEKLDTLASESEIFTGDLSFINEVDRWLISIIIPLDLSTFGGLKSTLSARVNLESLKVRIEKYQISESSELSVILPDGKKIFDENQTDISDRKLVQTAMNFINTGTRTSAVEPYERPDGEKMLGAYSLPNFLDWGVIVEVNEKDAYAAVYAMINNLRIWIIFGLFIAIIGAIIFSIYLTTPLQKLMRAVRELAKGNLKVKVEGKKRRDEIGELSNSFGKMVKDLNHYINELTETTKAKERAESELKLAWKIQSGFLPKNFPEFEEIDIWGTCEPAREVGGDYFDFFKIDEENYALVIGDVSGKGVPASLYMAVSRTLFRMISTAPDMPPTKAMTDFNNKLVELDQGSDLFITMFYGLYNLKTGKMVYSTAGHNMPYVGILNSDDGKFRMLPAIEMTMVAGMMDGIDMGGSEITLPSGSTIVLYTDGLTEPINTEMEEFGEERLEEIMNNNSELSAKELSLKMIEDVKEFQKDMPQFDDMTVFVMKVK